MACIMQELRLHAGNGSFFSIMIHALTASFTLTGNWKSTDNLQHAQKCRDNNSSNEHRLKKIQPL